MKNLKLLSPITNIKDFDTIAKTGCKSVYIYHSYFLEEKNHKLISNYIDKAKELDFDFYINFKNNIKESEMEQVKGFLDFLISCPISGILINSLDILEYIKKKKLPFKVIIDSGLNIHNLAGIEF